VGSSSRRADRRSCSHRRSLNRGSLSLTGICLTYDR
jgi:hypothetical protein